MTVLVVDDEKNLRESLKRYLEMEKYTVVTAENGLAAQKKLGEMPMNAVIADLKMPGMDGLELLGWIRERGPSVPVIMISAHGEVEDAVEAMKLGAEDYLVKPFEPEELVLRLKRVIEHNHLRQLFEMGKQEKGTIQGNAPAVEKIRRMALKIASTPSTVLITGESGTGKEVLARMIHSHSDRREAPFMAINIGGVPEALVESELFGHEKGAFTGASSLKKGLFELAATGTLFLDEIGEMPLHLQVKLLRVIQERRIQRLGGTDSIPIDVRIISATNRDLEEQIDQGAFREDLYYRLNVVHIPMPPLRERKEDIPLLAGAMLKDLNKKMGGKITAISPEGLKKLEEYFFPGNVRELENIIERAYIFTEGDTISAESIELPRRGNPVLPEDEKNEEREEYFTLKEVEKTHIHRVLHRWEGNKTKAAEELGISRKTLFNKIKEYGL